MPPVSISMNLLSSDSTFKEIQSLVVPGISLTIEKRFPAIRLKRVDFPTLGRPKIAITGMAFLVTGISLVVSAIGIMNVMFVSVRERTKEIGLRKAMGATNNNILVQFLSEAIAISIIGGVTGIILVKLMTVALASYTSFPIEFDLLLIFYTFMVCVFIGITSGILPARTAANLHPIDALRHE